MIITKYKNPVLFYSISTIVPWTFWFTAGYISHLSPYSDQNLKIASILGFIGLLGPVAVTSWLASRNSALRNDILRRIVNFKSFPLIYLILSCTLMLASILLAQAVSLLFGYSASQFVITGHFIAAGIVVLVAGFFDMLDGALARVTGRVSRFGGILDSTLDRLSEAVLLLGLLSFFVRQQQLAESMLVGVVLVGALMVSYLRSRVEAAGIDCSVGIFTRPERVIVLALGLLFSRFDYAMVTALAVIAAFSYFTAGQRLVYAWRRTRD